MNEADIFMDIENRAKYHNERSDYHIAKRDEYEQKSRKMRRRLISVNNLKMVYELNDGSRIFFKVKRFPVKILIRIYRRLEFCAYQKYE